MEPHDPLHQQLTNLSYCLRTNSASSYSCFLHHMFWVLHLVEQLGEKEILILLCFYAKCAIVTHFKQNSVHWLTRNEIASFVLSFMSENIGHGMSTMINTREKWGVIPFLVKLYLFGMWRSKRVDQDP